MLQSQIDGYKVFKNCSQYIWCLAEAWRNFTSYFTCSITLSKSLQLSSKPVHIYTTKYEVTWSRAFSGLVCNNDLHEQYKLKKYIQKRPCTKSKKEIIFPKNMEMFSNQRELNKPLKLRDAYHYWVSEKIKLCPVKY